MRKTPKRVHKNTSQQSQAKIRRGPAVQAETYCLTYTVNAKDLTIVAADASAGMTPPVAHIGEHLAHIWPQAADQLTDLITQVIVTKKPAAAAIHDLDVGIALAHGTGIPLPDADGNVVQIVLSLAIVEDQPGWLAAGIEPLKAMQALEQLPVGILWTDGQGQVKYTNKKQREITGYPVGRMLPRDLSRPHPRWLKPDTQESYRWSELPLTQTAQSGLPAERLVTSGFSADGNDQAFLIRAQPIFDTEGIMTDIIAVHVDVTAQHRAEQEIARRAAELETVIEGMIDGVILFDRHGVPLHYNRAALQIMGWEQAGVDPQVLSDAERAAFYDAHFMNGIQQMRDASPVHKVLAGEDSSNIEVSLRHDQGQRVIADMHAMALRDPLTHEIMGAVCIIRDVTRLRHIDYLKDEFMSVASHELRTPLTSLLMASRLMQRWTMRGDRNDDLRWLAGNVVSQVQHMDRLITNMLDLTRINAHHFMLTQQPGDLAQVVREVVAEYQRAGDHAISLSGIDEPIPALMDGERIQQVLSHLLTNAIKYDTSSQPIKVMTALVSDAQNPGNMRAQIAVQDHGCGITGEHMPHLFEQFYRVPKDDNEIEKSSEHLDGMGLGLYISQEIIAGHGGRIWAESTVGEGSTFYIELPTLVARSDYIDMPIHIEHQEHPQ
jgi:PAS domain S-box-containing protein